MPAKVRDYPHERLNEWLLLLLLLLLPLLLLQLTTKMSTVLLHLEDIISVRATLTSRFCLHNTRVSNNSTAGPQNSCPLPNRHFVLPPSFLRLVVAQARPLDSREYWRRSAYQTRRHAAVTSVAAAVQRPRRFRRDDSMSLRSPCKSVPRRVKLMRFFDGQTVAISNNYFFISSSFCSSFSSSFHFYSSSPSSF